MYVQFVSTKKRPNAGDCRTLQNSHKKTPNLPRYVPPGEILREDYTNEYNLTITEVAEGSGIARTSLSAIVNGRTWIGPEMAVKLAKTLGNTPQFWVNLQKNYELWHVDWIVNRSKIVIFGKTGRGNSQPK